MQTEKATADELLTLGIDFYNKSEWDRALECWEKAKKIYEVLRDEKGISTTLGNLGLVCQNKGDLELALRYYEKSLKISEDIGNKRGTLNALNNLGSVYQDKGDWEHAIECYKKSLEFSEELKDKEGISNAVNNLGIVYQNKGNFELALEYYEKNLKISEDIGNKRGTSNALNNLGIIYEKRGDWERAIEYYKKSLKIKEELENKQGISNTLNNLGIVYQYKGDWVRAIEYTERSLKISKELGYKLGISNTLNSMGEINIKNGNWDEARNNLEGSLAIAEKLAPISTTDALTNLGELLRLEENYSDAFASLEKAIQIINQVGYKPKEIDILEKLGDIHLDKYTAYKIEENLYSAERFYTLALELASSLNMPLQEATATRGIGIVQAKKGDLVASKEFFMKSVITLRRLGAFFELQKTLHEYGRTLYESDNLIEAEMVAKTVSFDAWHNNYKELLVKAYLLLGDITMKQERHYGYYLDALRASEFNPKIFVRTCFIMIFRMKNMEKQLQPKFIASLKEINNDKDKYFNQFLDALNAKLEGREYDTTGLPSSLEQELKNFSV